MSDTVDFGPNESALYCLDAEQSVIGCVLINPDCLAELDAFLKAEDFYLHKHRWIWECFQLLKDRCVDVVTVADELNRRNQLADLGGTAYLVQCLNSVPTSLHAEAYGRLVQKDSIRRRMLEAATNIAKLAYAAEREIADVVGEAQDCVTELLDGGGGDSLRPVREQVEVVSRTILEPEQRQKDKLHLGIPRLDRLFTLERGDLCILMARPSMGKTAAMVQIADLVSEAGLVVAFFTKEMTSSQIVLRMACRRAHVCLSDILSGAANEDDRQKVAKETFLLHERSSLYIDDRVPQSTDEVFSLCWSLSQRVGHLDLVLADHLRMFSNRADNETHRLGSISSGLKSLAKRLDTRVLCSAQLSRAVEHRADRRPDLDDLRDSGQIEEDADDVVALYRSKYYDPQGDDIAEFIIRKMRNGVRNDAAQCVFLGPCMSFEPLADNF